MNPPPAQLSAAPAVSLVTVAYNCADYIPATIESVFRQTLQNWEWLIIDNASTDRTGAILSEISDPRVRIIRNEQNTGPAAANLGFRAAKGRYIARLDPDDIALPERFEIQCKHLDCHPEIGLCGSYYDTINERGERTGVHRDVCDPSIVRWKLGWQNFIGHSTVMIRREVAERLNGYDEELWCAEDYDFITRACSVTDISMIPSVLALYRVYNGSISFERRTEMARNSLMVAVRYIGRMAEIKQKEAAVTDAVRVMRGEVVAGACRWPDVLSVILSYTKVSSMNFGASDSRFIARETAKRLLEYARLHLKGAPGVRLLFELAVAWLSPGMLISRVQSVIERFQSKLTGQNSRGAAEGNQHAGNVAAIV